MHMKKYELAIKKTHKEDKNLFKSKKTTSNKRVLSVLWLTMVNHECNYGLLCFISKAAVKKSWLYMVYQKKNC